MVAGSSNSQDKQKPFVEITQPTFDEEGILQITRGMLLRDEKGVEIPERRLHEAIRGHLRETHLEEDLAEFFSDLQKWM